MARQLTRTATVAELPIPVGPVAVELPGPRDGRTLAAAVLLSWLAPLALGLARLDVLLLPLLVLAVASVIRVGGGLLDRLVIASFLFCGALLTIGLLASEWPWGLSPLPAASLLLTVVSTAAWYGRRRPRLPWRVRGTDAVILGAGALALYFVHKGVSGTNGPGELMSGDRFTHFSIFDTIYRVHGYLFLHQAAAKPSVLGNTAAVYPQGSHLLLAWIDVFVRSSTAVGPLGAAYQRYCDYITVAFALFVMAVVWATRWMAGPRLTGWRMAAVCSSVAALLLAGPMVELLFMGFDSETIGLTFLAVAVGLLLRPAMGRTEFALTAATGLITVGYCYNLYLVYVAIVLLGALVVRYQADRRHRLPIYLTVLAGGAVAVLPSAISVLSSFDVAGQAVASGALIPLSRSLVIGIGLLVLLAVLGGVRGRGTTAPVRTLLFTLAGVVGVLVLFGGYQLATVHKLSYYFEKLTFAGFVICLVGLGAVGYLLRPARYAGSQAGLPRRLREPTLALGVAAAVLSLFAGFQWGVPSVNTVPAQWHSDPLVRWSVAGYNTGIGPGTHTLLVRDLARLSAPVVTLYTDSGSDNWRTTYYAEDLLRSASEMAGLSPVYRVNIGGSFLPEHALRYRRALAELRSAIDAVPGRPTVLVGNRRLAEQLDHDLTRAGDKPVTVEYAPLLSH